MQCAEWWDRRCLGVNADAPEAGARGPRPLDVVDVPAIDRVSRVQGYTVTRSFRLAAFTERDPQRATLVTHAVEHRSCELLVRLGLQSAVFDYIEASTADGAWHSTLDMLSPSTYEQPRLSPLGS